jgi:hypothetical protein
VVSRTRMRRHAVAADATSGINAMLQQAHVRQNAAA